MKKQSWSMRHPVTASVIILAGCHLIWLLGLPWGLQAMLISWAMTLGVLCVHAAQSASDPLRAIGLGLLAFAVLFFLGSEKIQSLGVSCAFIGAVCLLGAIGQRLVPTIPDIEER